MPGSITWANIDQDPYVPEDLGGMDKQLHGNPTGVLPLKVPCSL